MSGSYLYFTFANEVTSLGTYAVQIKLKVNLKSDGSEVVTNVAVIDRMKFTINVINACSATSFIR